MENRTSFKEQLKGTVEELYELLENLESKLQEGTKEAKEIFDKEKKHFTTFLEDQKQYWQRFGLQDDEGFRKLTDKLEQLSTMLNEPDPENEAAFSAWKDQRLRVIYELEFLAREFYPEMNEKEKEFFNALKIRQENYRLKLAGTGFQDVALLAEEQKDLSRAILEAIHFIENEVVVDWSRLDGFKEEISVSFDHLKKAFGNLIQK